MERLRDENNMIVIPFHVATATCFVLHIPNPHPRAVMQNS